MATPRRLHAGRRHDRKEENLPVITDRAGVRRLAACLVVALLLHVAVLRLLPAPAPASAPRGPLSATLAARPPTALPPHDAAAGAHNRVASRIPVDAPEPVAPAAVRTAPVPGEAPKETAPSAAILIESARRIARTEALRGASAQSAPAPGQTPEAVIARALRRPDEGEQRIGRDLLKVTTARGATYCLKTSNDAPRWGVIEPLSVPTNCP